MPLLSRLEMEVPTGFSLSWQLTTVKRQLDAACRDLVAVTPKLHKVKAENDEMRTHSLPFVTSFRCPIRHLCAFCCSLTRFLASYRQCMTWMMRRCDLPLASPCLCLFFGVRHIVYEWFQSPYCESYSSLLNVFKKQLLMH